MTVVPRRLLAVLLLLLPVVQGAQLEEAGQMGSARFFTAAGAVEEAAYAFGGQAPGGVWLDQVVRADGTGVRLQEARLPEGRSHMAAAGDGEVVYLFGGWAGPDGGSDQVLRYDPDQDQVTVLEARLPEPRWSMAAAWTGEHVLLLGGDPCDAPCEVLRFDPGSGTLAGTGLHLETAVAEGAAFWDGEAAYLLGGRVPRGNSSEYHDRVWRIGDEIETLPVRLPEPRTAAAMVWDGRTAYLLGGATTGADRLDTIAFFDPQDRAVGHLATVLPEASMAMGSAWAGGAGYAFGAGTAFRQVLRFMPEDAQDPGPATPTGTPSGTPSATPTSPSTPSATPGAPTASATPTPGPEACPECDCEHPTGLSTGLQDRDARAWVHFQVPLACAAAAYGVFVDGELVLEVPAALGQAAYRRTFTAPEPGRHEVAVQALAEDQRFDPANATTRTLDVPFPEASPTQAGPTADEEPAGGRSTGLLLTAGVLVAAVVMVLLLRRREDRPGPP